jgi:hypothetical protein
MFRNLARLLPAPAVLGAAGPARQVFRVHPFQLICRAFSGHLFRVSFRPLPAL